jgi:hypothetical protein
MPQDPISEKGRRLNAGNDRERAGKFQRRSVARGSVIKNQDRTGRAEATQEEISTSCVRYRADAPRSTRPNFRGAHQGAAFMVTTKNLRRFADDCLAWASKQDDPSHKQSIITAALSWKAIADAIDSQVKEGRAEVLDDLKTKLN